MAIISAIIFFLADAFDLSKNAPGGPIIFSGGACILAAVGAYYGGRVLPIATSIIHAVHIPLLAAKTTIYNADMLLIFLSPSALPLIAMIISTLLVQGYQNKNQSVLEYRLMETHMQVEGSKDYSGLQKGFGISAIVIAVTAIFVTLFGPFVSGAACFIAAVGAYYGERSLSIATSVIHVVNTALLSPLFIGLLMGPRGEVLAWLVVVLICSSPSLLPLIAMKISKKGK